MTGPSSLPVAAPDSFQPTPADVGRFFAACPPCSRKLSRKLARLSPHDWFGVFFRMGLPVAFHEIIVRPTGVPWRFLLPSRSGAFAAVGLGGQYWAGLEMGWVDEGVFLDWFSRQLSASHIPLPTTPRQMDLRGVFFQAPVSGLVQAWRDKGRPLWHKITPWQRKKRDWEESLARANGYVSVRHREGNERFVNAKILVRVRTEDWSIGVNDTKRSQEGLAALFSIHHKQGTRIFRWQKDLVWQWHVWLERDRLQTILASATPPEPPARQRL